LGSNFAEGGHEKDITAKPTELCLFRL
jgi:hypothetical protein